MIFDIIKYRPDDYYLIKVVDGEKLAFHLGEGIPFDELIKSKHEYEENQKQYWSEEQNEE